MAALDFSRVRALIFDLDGTLIDSKQDLIRSVNAMLVEVGRGQLHEETISGYIGHGAPTLVARALGNGARAEQREQALKFFLAHYEAHKLDSTRPYPGVAEALRELRGFPMAVLTNKPVRVSRRILEGLGGDSEVDVQTARNAGTLAAAVNYGFGTHDRAAYPADVYLERLTDLAPLLQAPRR
jgi:phosphoglycolate phosphatase